MKFKFENLGSIKNGELELNDLTIICGKNNTGKTYVNYAIYGFYKKILIGLRNTIRRNKYIERKENNYYIDLQQVYNNLDNINDYVLKEYNEMLYEVFNSEKDIFKDTKISIKHENLKNKEYFYRECESLSSAYSRFTEAKVIVKRENNILTVSQLEDNASESLIRDIILEGTLVLVIRETLYKDSGSIFMLPAERSGVNLFFKELNVSRNDMIFNLNKNNTIEEVMNKVAKYALPVSDYINFLNSLDNKNSDGQEKFKNIAKSLEKEVIEGSYIITEDNSIEFMSISKESKKIEFHIASSTAKTLFGLDYYLNHNASINEFLVIDEPELNLHPDNQRKLARIIARIVNAGVKVLISTHSDYIIKELNNLIILGRKFEGFEELIEKYDYKEEELLQENRISAYISRDNSITEADIDDEGIIMSTFDDVINCYNKSSDDIFYTYLEGQNE